MSIFSFASQKKGKTVTVNSIKTSVAGKKNAFTLHKLQPDDAKLLAGLETAKSVTQAGKTGGL